MPLTMAQRILQQACVNCGKYLSEVTKMNLPLHLKQGDLIAIVAPSSGLAGEKDVRWRSKIGIDNLKKLGYRVKVMPNALKDKEWNYHHPKARARELTDAFLDPEVKAILCTIGGNESARIIPYLNETTIRENPKIFIGYSDITALHLYFNTLGLVTFYGPALLTDFAENVALDRYTLDYLFRLIGDVRALGYIETSPYTRRFGLRWEESLKDIEREKTLNSNYVLIQGNQPASGPLIGGCFESLDKLRGTPYFPDINEFNDKILFIETSEVITEPWSFEETMRSFGYMGIFHRINGMVIGRPQNGTYQREYHMSIVKILKEFDLETMPVIGNASFGHNEPKCTLPYGIKAKISIAPVSLYIEEPAVR